ncbi:histidine N-alpha-methyltransferase-like [Ptychodera flava]|uniref:histidine N-alpha-methyltransferase-like n=1 Tax=Ptychodera flava TaxID=63121 RepID=UPI00396A790B
MEKQILESAIPNTATQSDLVSTILPGLQSCPKYVPHWYVYDKLGSELFDRVTNENPHYHLYRVETSLLKEHTGSIIRNFDESSIFAELGAGNSSKMHSLIEAMLEKEGSLRFIPIDIAKEFLEESAKTLNEKFPSLNLQPFVGDYVDGMEYVKSLQGPKLFIFLGSSFSNIPMAQMLPFLQTVRNTLKGNRDRFLIGLDITREPEIVEEMYGHFTFADFNRNVLTRLNKDFRANFMQENFEHYANYHKNNDKDTKGLMVEDPEYIELGFRSKHRHTVSLDSVGTKIAFQEDEIFYTHVPGNMSMKWDWQQFEKLANLAGLVTDQLWTDPGNKFALGLLKADSK